MLDTADSTSPNHPLFDAGFVRRQPSRPGDASRHTHRPAVNAARSERDINAFATRRATYSKRDLPRNLDCAPKGGRLLCTLEEKFANRGFTWAPVIRLDDGGVVKFDHDAQGYATLTNEQATVLAGQRGARVTVTLDEQRHIATLHEITIDTHDRAQIVRELHQYRGAVAIDITCTNKPTFNGQDVTFEDLYHQKASIFDPHIPSAD